MIGLVTLLSATLIAVSFGLPNQTVKDLNGFIDSLCYP
jgi:hypothetical protein